MENFRTYQLAVTFFHECQKITLHGPAKNQFDRAVLSIVLNLAEGSAKPSAKERRKFYFISRGSFQEVKAIMQLFPHETKTLYKTSDILGAHLYKLCKKT